MSDWSYSTHGSERHDLVKKILSDNDVTGIFFVHLERNAFHGVFTFDVKIDYVV